jgi:hypothetical protein
LYRRFTIDTKENEITKGLKIGTLGCAKEELGVRKRAKIVGVLFLKIQPEPHDGGESDGGK